jgi:hypothetical protein
LGVAPFIKDNTLLTLLDFIDRSKPRPPIRISLGCHVLGASNPHVDPNCVDTVLDGAGRRYARDPPKSDPLKMARMRSFVSRWLKKHLTALPSDIDTSFDTWIKNTPYSQSRKAELQQVYDDSHGLITPDNLFYENGTNGQQAVNKFCRINSFVKDETYQTYKSARTINSRHDVFKVRVGPIFKLIEKELFSLPWFIKHTPTDERAEEIKRVLFQSGATIIGTDYTAYESLFTKEFMDVVEFQLYSYMTQNIIDTDWIRIVIAVLSGPSVCQYRNKFTLQVDATRMSGEMCTSLGNSFANLMAMKFIAKENGLKSLRGRVEGDDGIFTFYGPPPTAEDFAAIGMIIKIDIYHSLTEGSFCGIIADADEMINVKDPISAMLNLGWTTREYIHSKPKKLLELLRAKAMSLAYQYPGCPVLASLAQYALRITHGYHYNVKHWDGHAKHEFSQLHKKFGANFPIKSVGINTRILVEKRYGLSLNDQLIIENYLDSKTDLSPLDHPTILSNCHRDAIDYASKYVFAFPSKASEVQIECPIYDDYGLSKSFNTSFLNYEWKRNTKKGQGYEKAYCEAGSATVKGNPRAGYRSKGST